jgi:GNAT superfamily N-acetyltransferase
VDALVAYREFDAARMSLLSTRTIPFVGGTAYFDDGYPERYISNLVAVDGDSLSAEHLLSATDELLGGAGLGHRRIHVRDDAAGARMAPTLRAHGYADERVVVMLLRRTPDRRPILPVEEHRFDEVRGLTEEIYRRELPNEPTTAARFVRQHAAWDRALGTRRFVVRLDGALAGQCELYAIGPDAQIEYVDTLEEYRGRGVARAVVVAAIDAASDVGARHVFICADVDDWPKELYGRLGFDAIGCEWEFTRAPAR